ncbi:hypothetical protein ACGFRG_02070 [Streptomyces sp. NPDC048696]|uniref:hypothetical protein n=1 Tax=Streptomyces sp. NPDC048696 TaxID=3365585 RepID=UPI003723069D
MTLLRRDDMVVLTFNFINLAQTGVGADRKLVVANPASPAALSVELPPQAVLEEATSLGGATTGVKAAQLSGPSTLTLGVPPNASIPFTAAGLLNWASLATTRDGTSLECVWGLSFRPVPTAVTWVHAVEPVTSAAGVTGLWQTHLALPPAATDPAGALASTLPVSLDSGGVPRPSQDFVSSLTPSQRGQIADAMGARPVLAKRLALNALGAEVDLTGNWDGVQGVGVTAYRHQSVGGRDTVVQVVERGYLFPLGFPVQISTCTERRLDYGLVQTSHLVVLVPRIAYTGLAALPHEGRGFPFEQVRLNGPLTADVSSSDEQFLDLGFWVYGPDESDRRRRFSLTAEDSRGHSATFSAPLAFVRGNLAYAGLDDAARLYTSQVGDLALPAAGRVELAPTTGDTPESSTVEVAALHIGAEPSTVAAADLENAGLLAAFPRLLGVEARLPALDAFTAQSVGGAMDVTAGQVQRLERDIDYVEHGLTAAKNVYARLQNPASLAPPAATTGAVASLAMSVTGLSSQQGLIGGDLAAFKNGRFDPLSYFAPPAAGGVSPAKLLGFLNLPELIPPIPDFTTIGDREDVPRMVTEVLRPPGALAPPDRVRTTLTWHTKVKVDTFGPLVTTADTELELRGTTLIQLAGGEPQAEIRGELRSFTLSFLSILDIKFKRLAFTSKTGTSPSLDPKIGEVTFAGDLQFLDALRHYLPSPDNGPRITSDPDRIEIGYSLAIPSIGIGVFLMQNLALSASVVLPLRGAGGVSAAFALSSRDHPFLVTVSLFGGGGFFRFEVDSGQIQLEAQLEFGAATALDLGVASGSVSVTAGIYLYLAPEGSKIKGFLRAVGALDVLGIITISVEFYLALEFRPPKEVHGIASVTVRVRLAFFSQAVTLSVERSFSGGGDPSFGDAFPTQVPWQARCDAFAPMGDQ